MDLIASTQSAKPSLALAAGWLFLMRWASKSFWGSAIIGLAGTLFHELAHILIGWILRGKPVGISLWPEKHANRWVLGSATFSNLNVLNAGPIAFAPLLLLVPAWLLIIEIAQPSFDASYFGCWALSCYLAANCLYSALPSREDVRLGGLSALLYCVVIFMLYWNIAI